MAEMKIVETATVGDMEQFVDENKSASSPAFVYFSGAKKEDGSYLVVYKECYAYM
jgi:hypothetical protein